MILHIQNAHGNYEAQVQIKKLLDYLDEKYREENVSNRA